MISIKRTIAQNADFITLVKELDAFLKITDGEEHDFYNQFNHIDVLEHVVVAYEHTSPSKKAIGCGAIKKYNPFTMEIKRMYVTNDHRGSGVAQKLLTELEQWTKELGYKKCVLETGKRQHAAVKFYIKCGYEIIPNYGQYINRSNSICFEKTVI